MGDYIKTKEENYGIEIILDLHNCDVSKFNRKSLEEFTTQLCTIAEMDGKDLHFWDFCDKNGNFEQEEYDAAPPWIQGTSCIKFIKTSNITIHTIDPWQRVYLNFFTCKTFDEVAVKNFIKEFFKGDIVNCHVMQRV